MAVRRMIAVLAVLEMRAASNGGDERPQQSRDREGADTAELMQFVPRNRSLTVAALLAAAKVWRMAIEASDPANPPAGTPPSEEGVTPGHQGSAHSEDAQKESGGPGIHQPDGELEHPNVRFEERQVPVGWVLAIAIITCCIGAVIFVGVHFFLKSQESTLAIARKSPFPLVQHPSDKLPPEPRLEQVDRVANVKTPNVFLRERAKEEILNGYGTTDEKGFVHIPIEGAMELIAGHLPVRKQPEGSETQEATSKDDGLVDAGDPNSGRMFQKGTH
jgi:hypothetical protein